jgi:hypothetical protein
MPASILQRPADGDYFEYYAFYIGLVPAGDLVDLSRQQVHDLRTLLQSLTDAQSYYRYAADKWSVREVVGHLIDTERVFAYRATAFSRHDPSPLPSFDQDAWTPAGEYDARSLSSLLDEWEAARHASLALMKGMPDAALDARGVASDNSISVLACLCILHGHVQYHIATLERDYLTGK